MISKMHFGSKFMINDTSINVGMKRFIVLRRLKTFRNLPEKVRITSFASVARCLMKVVVS